MQKKYIKLKQCFKQKKLFVKYDCRKKKSYQDPYKGILSDN